MSNVQLEDAFRKNKYRILPFVALMFAMAVVDRSNIGFAKSALQIDTGLSDGAFAWGAGIFFIGYALFEIPSNIILHKVGARKWLSRIMVSWGLLSAAMIFTTGETSLFILRFALGVAEAGLSPGIILYLTYWFPENRRGSAYGIYYFGVPVSLMLSSPLSGWLLENPHFGLTGWQWMFLTEGLGASVIGIFAFSYLKDSPSDASWLSFEEKKCLGEVLKYEKNTKNNIHVSSWQKAIIQPAILYLTFIYFTIQVSTYGVLFYLPTRISEIVDTEIGLEVGKITAIPWITTICTLYIVTRYADRKKKQANLAAWMLGLAAIGMIGSTLTENLTITLISFCLSASGFITVQPLFWTLPARLLGGVAAAGAFAFIGALGNLGGFCAPTAKHKVNIMFSNPHAGMYLLSGIALLGAIMLTYLDKFTVSGSLGVNKKIGEQEL